MKTWQEQLEDQFKPMFNFIEAQTGVCERERMRIFIEKLLHETYTLGRIDEAKTCEGCRDEAIKECIGIMEAEKAIKSPRMVCIECVDRLKAKLNKLTKPRHF